MPIDITRPRWRAAEAVGIAGLDDAQAIRNLRSDYGLKLGKLEAGGHRFSVLDIAELTTIVAGRALGFDYPSAIKLARDELRPNLRDVLNNRLVHGFWSVGAVELDGEAPPFAKRTLYLDQIADRVIVKLALPLPVDPQPRSIEVAVRMVDAIFDYIESTVGRVRWDTWYATVTARGGKVPIGQAAIELGAPLWFMRALLAALARASGGDAIIVKVRPKAPKLREYLGATLQ